MNPHLELGMRCKVIPIDGSEPFEDYIKQHFVGSHFVTSKGIEIDYDGYEAIPTRHHIPIRKPHYEIEWLDDCDKEMMQEQEFCVTACKGYQSIGKCPADVRCEAFRSHFSKIV